MTGLTLYFISLAAFTIPWIAICTFEYKSRLGLNGITILYTLLTFIPFVNIPFGIISWAIVLYYLSARLASYINSLRNQ